MSPRSDPPGPSDETVPAEQWQARAIVAQRGGDFLGTYDAAMRGIAAHPDSVNLWHRAILALANTGATAKAKAMLRDLGAAPGQEDELAALEALLSKEQALSSTGDERIKHALTAATLYECIHARTGGTFSGINAALMRLFAGDPERTEMLARQTLEACAKDRSASPEEAYYITATEAEAWLLLGDTEKASSKLRVVHLLSGDDHTTRAALRRHLRRVCDARAIPVNVLDILKPPSVVHYTGYRMAPPGYESSFAPPAERYVTEQIAAYLSARKVGFGYGSLGSGADILFAEALLASGAELHVVLPIPEDEFCRAAVAPGGERWIRRFKACLKSATSITLAGTLADACADLLLAFGERIAMGMALLRARALDADVEQAAVWEGEKVASGWGPDTDVAAWRARGLRTFFIDPGAPSAGSPSPFHARAADGDRVICAMLLGELTGCAKLEETRYPVFVREILGALGRAIDEHEDNVLSRSSWGDAFSVVMKTAESAARCALDLQACVGSSRVDLQACKLEYSIVSPK